MSYVRPDRRILRASDADRERAVDFLRAHAGEGRLDHEELAERVGRALSAKTLGELSDLTFDLPVEPAVVPPASVAPPYRRSRSVGTFVAARIALVYLIVLIGLGLHNGARFVIPLLIVVAVLSMRQVRRVGGRSRRSGGPPRDWPQLPY